MERRSVDCVCFVEEERDGYALWEMALQVLGCCCCCACVGVRIEMSCRPLDEGGGIGFC